MTARHWITMLLMSFLGGLVGAWIFRMPEAEAQGKNRVLQADQLWIYATDRKHRIQMGTYTRGGEKGQPLMGFSDSKGKLKLLFRLYGTGEAPVAVFKDNNGRDRMVIGLRGHDHAPFIACYDAAGKATMVHGSR